MKLNKITSIIICSAMAVTSVSGCAKGENKDEKKTHEPITITSDTDVDSLAALVHKKYPDVVLEVAPYIGKNTSAYTSDQLITGEMPDIYVTSLAWVNLGKEMKEHLIDLSGYEFTDCYDPNLLSQQEIDGALYLLPSNYNLISMAYNKTLFEEHGWKVPESFEEVKELAPEIEKAGVDLAVTNSELAGNGFQYMCNLGDTLELSSIKGRQWQKDFLSGNSTAEEGFGDALDYMEEWMDIGLLEGVDSLGGKPAFETFAEGNTAFYLGTAVRWTQNEDGTGDVFVPMPYLSRDGSNNMYITLQSKNFGLNKSLEKPGNEQKLEDALHVMEVLSTVEGQDTFKTAVSSSISSLLDWRIDESSPFAPCMELLNAGQSSPLIYDGWDAFLAELGQYILEYINGEHTKQDVLNETERLLKQSLENGAFVYSEVDRQYSTEETAMLVGRIFGTETDADCALISYNKLVGNGSIQNSDGVNGTILPLPLTDMRIVSVIPTGWNDTIKTVTLTGSQIKEYAEKGYCIERDGKSAVFPYVFTVKSNKELDDTTTYKVAVCGADTQMQTDGNIQDSGVEGLEACKKFFEERNYPPVSDELLNWSE